MRPNLLATLGIAGGFAAILISVPMCIASQRQLELAASRVAPRRSTEPGLDGNSQLPPTAGFEATAREAATHAPAEAGRASAVPPAGAPEMASAGAFVTAFDLAEMDESYAITPEGLYAYTTEEWSQEYFADITKEEAEALLGESLGTYPASVQELLGGFPTIEDCEEALTHGDVVRYLREMILLDAELVKIAMREIDGPGPSEATRETKRLALAAKDGVEIRLWKKLDEVTAYKNWSVLGRLFRAWSRPTK